MRRLLAACLLALTTGCNPVQTPPPGDGGAGTARSFTFVIENFDADR